MDLTGVEVFVDPSCPWAWITSRWIAEVASERDLSLTWRSYCLEIRDDYGVAATVPEAYRERALDGHALSHRMLRVFEAARADSGEIAVDALYTEWGRRYFLGAGAGAGVGAGAAGTAAAAGAAAGDALLSECLTGCGLSADLLAAADDDKWDVPIVESMEVAYEFGGPKTQTPTIVVRATTPYGFKGPVMAPAPKGEAALRLWDAIAVIAQEPGFFEITRPRANLPKPTPLD
jgi:2-hydroxychromene-2-carboxylate isomerase